MSLESIFRVLLVVQDLPAHSQDQIPMTLHQGGKSIFIPLAKETMEQLPIRKPRQVAFPDQLSDIA